MKNSTMRSMIAVAALAVAAGSASAQTFKTEIPMSFRLGKTDMAPGVYQIRVAPGVSGRLIFVRNLATRSTVMLLPQTTSDTPKLWRQDGNARVVFECLGNACGLRRVWSGDGPAYEFKAARPPSLEAHATSIVTLAMVEVH